MFLQCIGARECWFGWAPSNGSAILGATGWAAPGEPDDSPPWAIGNGFAVLLAQINAPRERRLLS
jgi:hypothetical protein